MKAYILSGSSFGDEGKGTFVDYLAHELNIKNNIRYNGGSQASHTVILDNKIKHSFSQLGSSMFIPGNKTFLSSGTVINIFNLVEEAKVFAGDDYLQILDRVFIDGECKVVTPYHILCNRIRESGGNRRGSVGTGVSEVTNILEEAGLCLQMKNLLDGTYIEILDKLYDYTTKMADGMPFINQSNVYNTTLHKKHIRECYKGILKEIKFNVITGVNEFTDGSEDVILEGSQGLLIDKNYGIKPNTTLLDTTNHNGVKLANDLSLEPVRIGLIRAFQSRHGIGVLPTYDEYLSNKIHDPNQENNPWTGRDPIYGWFDAVLLRYSQMINKNDEYYISCLDLLAGIDVLKVCDSYLFNGNIDSEFERVFEYYINDNKIIITNILNNTDKLKAYLERCTPIYIEIPGYQDDYSEYLNQIEELAGINITLVSNGPTRKEKVRRYR